MSVGRMKSLPVETSCTSQCPLGISPQGYIGLTKAGKYEEAYELIWKKNPLLSVCARGCHHPCEEGCKRGILVDSPIKIREVKRYLSEKVDYTPKPYVTVYEEATEAGGMTAVDFMERTNNKLNMRRHLGQLFKFKDGRAVIIGGGSVAVDCARTALRVGASKVTVVCLEEGDNVPAHPWEVQEAKEKGVFYAGDYSSNKCSVVDAMASGKATAYEVDAKLRGCQLKVAPVGTERLQPAPVNEKLFPYNFRKTLRPETPMVDPEIRKHNFEDVEKTFTDKEAYIETDACLGCGYSGVDSEKYLGCGLCQQMCPKGGVITMVAKGGEI